MSHQIPCLAISIVISAAASAQTPPAGDATKRPTTAPTEPAPVVMTERGRRVHRMGIVVDGHNDMPWQIRQKGDSSFEKIDISQPQPQLHTDIPRLRAGGVDAQFWVVFVPPEMEKEGVATREALRQFKLIHEMVRRYDDTFELARTADDVVRIERIGKIAALIGVEGGHMLQNSLERVSEFHELGERYLGLTHSTTIDWADSATDEARHGGLTEFGEQVVRELNRVGMLVDLAHVSADTMRDALRVSKAPVIASHSGAYAVAEHTRNVPDDVLRMMRDNGGVVMVNFFPGYTHPEGARSMARYFEVQREMKAKYPDKSAYDAAWKAWRAAHPIPQGTVHTLIDHIDHIVRVAGIDHVGLGSDYDGVGIMPKQLEDVSGYPFVTQALLDRGYSKEDVHKVLGGNLLRALREAERVAREWDD